MELHTTALSRARRQLETQGRFPGGALPGDIADSWLRSLDHGLDPLGRAERLVRGSTELAEARTRHADLIRFARPELELLYDQIAGSNFMIALGSPEGMVLETLTDTQFADTEAGRSVIPGSVWTEDLRGTNALGLSLTTRRPAQVYGGEHFLRAHADVSCISAPIFDGRGALAGVLDASSGSTVRQQHTAALVQMSASNIENCLIRAGHDRRIVLQFHPRPEYLGTLSVGMLVLDDDLTIHAVNRRGAVFLTGISQIIGAAFDQLFESRFQDVQARLVQGETLRLRDRFGSAVSMRCVANRASVALAGRNVARDAPEPRNLFRDVVIDDPALLHQLRAMPAAARRGTAIAITGETGTGKEIVARLAHAASCRTGPFVTCDARLVAEPDFLTLFLGTGPEAPGLLAEASGGSLFLDEVTALPPLAQTALARVLDLGEYRRPGQAMVLRTDVLVRSASTEPFDAAVAAGRLLPALRFRLEGFGIHLPALRDRSDLVPLVERFARSIRPDIAVETEAVGRLFGHTWPGNLHELRSVVTRAALTATGPLLTAAHFPDFGPVSGDDPGVCPQCQGIPWKEQHCRAIRHRVDASLGNVALAARHLGMSRTTVYKHMERPAAPQVDHARQAAEHAR